MKAPFVITGFVLLISAMFLVSIGSPSVSTSPGVDRAPATTVVMPPMIENFALITGRPGSIVATSPLARQLAERQVVKWALGKFVEALPLVAPLGSYQPNVEALIALSPDSIIATTALEPMTRAGFKVFTFTSDDPFPIAEIFLSAARKHERIGALESAFASDLRAIKEETEGGCCALSPRVLILGWYNDGLVNALGRKSRLASYLKLVGADNVLEGSDAVAVKLDPERILALDPDVIILLPSVSGWSKDPATFMGDIRFKGLRAVRAERVYAEPFWAPQTSLVEAPLYASWLLETLHPTARRKVAHLTKAAYKRWLSVDLTDELVDFALARQPKTGRGDRAPSADLSR